jgi:WS/DGAT/MGAT family acyltransferase
VALYTKIHHAVLDGQGGVALAKVLLDLEPSSPRKRGPSDVRSARKSLDSRFRGNDGFKATLRANVKQLVQALRAVPPTIKVAAAKSEVTWRQRLERLRDSLLFAPRTPFNAQCSDERSFASATLSLDAVKRVAKANGASLNDVVLAVCTTVLRDHLARSGDLPRKPLIAAMPVSLRSRDDAEVDNQVSMVQCPIPTDVDDPFERLRAITAATMGIKRSVGEFRHLIPTDFPGLGAPRWAPGLSRLWARSRLAEKLPVLANVAISNVPGPPVPLFLAGAAVRHIFPVSIVTHGLGLNITVQTYAGMLEFGLTACKQALPRPLALAKALQPALDELLAPLDE